MTNKTITTNTFQFFTVVAQNYLAYALVLGESVLQYHPDANFSIFLVDDVDRRWKDLIESRGFAAIYPEQISLSEYRKFVFQYNITEACTGVKPFVMQMLLERGADTVIYLDPDILCFRRFDEVIAALERCNIVLTPHICSPAPGDFYPGEKDFLKSGVFNLGFIALRNNKTAAEFLRWWSSHLQRDCVQEPDAGLFVDQKWIDLAPTCFDEVHILRNPAYNIAYWNLHERQMEERNGILYESQSGVPVAFMHFSGITESNLDGITKYVQRNPLGSRAHKKRYTLRERPDLVAPFKMYANFLTAANAETFARIIYAYGAYDNGESISQLERSMYLASDEWRDSNADPFRTVPGSFWEACRNAGVRDTSRATIRTNSQETIQKYGPYMQLIEFCLKCCVRLLGPEKYLDFAKYMRHQFLPHNHGFVLPAPESTPPETSATEAEPHERERYTKPACEPPKI